jgi:hypothetical protein
MGAHLDLGETIGFVTALLEDADRACGTYADDPSKFHARHRLEMDRIGRQLSYERGARINDAWDGTTVMLAGIRASSTTGLAGALRNWRIAARKRLAAIEGTPIVEPKPYRPQPKGVDERHRDVINLQGSGPAPIKPR